MIKTIAIGLLLFSCNSRGNDLRLENCGTNKQSVELAKLIMTSNNQLRSKLECSSKLSVAANLKALAMASKNKVSHNIENISPNQHLKNNGIALPFKYPVIGNQVEAISGGKKTAPSTFDYFMTSEDHKAHLLGENSFYQEQNQIGVGFFYDKNSKHGYYWVVYITSLREDGEKIEVFPKTKYVFAKKTKKNKEKFKRGDTLSKRIFKQ